MTAERVPDYSVDPATGFLQSTNYIQAFDAAKKERFLTLYRKNGLKFWRTCAELGVKGETVQKHFNIDPEFNLAVKHVKTEYYDELEGVSRENALNPRSVIERIFQLKSAFPDRYGDNKRESSTNIQINFDGKAMSIIGSRETVLDVSEIKNTAENGDDFGAMNGIDDERPLV